MKSSTSKNKVTRKSSKKHSKDSTKALNTSDEYASLINKDASTGFLKNNVDIKTNAKRQSSTKMRKRLFVEGYLQFGSVGEAAKYAGIKSRKTVYNWLQTDKRFAESYEVMKANRVDQITSALYRAVLGEIQMSGAQVTSAMFLLKALEPRIFCEKHQLEVAGGDKAIVEIKTIEIVKDYGC